MSHNNRKKKKIINILYNIFEINSLKSSSEIYYLATIMLKLILAEKKPSNHFFLIALCVKKATLLLRSGVRIGDTLIRNFHL